MYHYQFNLTSVIALHTDIKTVLFQTIQFSLRTVFFVCTQLNVKTALFQLFQTIQFSISTWFSSTWPIGATTLGSNGPGSNGNEEVLCIPQSSSIIRASPSDCLVSYQGHSWGMGLNPLQRSSQCILQTII